MTLEQKVGQLLMVHFHGEQANEQSALLIQELHVGGFILYNWANGLHSVEQTAHLTSGLQNLSPDTPLLIAVDQEGGRVMRLKEGFTQPPDNETLGTKAPSTTHSYAAVVGKELRSVGVNFNLAPVVDINSNPKNRVIGSRSFGATAEKVICYAKEALAGYHESHMITALKHFPGHGDVTADSHLELPILNKSKEELFEEELKPFFALAPFTETIMTAHILVPALDPEHCATLSSKILNLLRNEAHFKGVILSDSLIMNAIIQNCGSIEEAAEKAFNAGCDILLLGGKQLSGANINLELQIEDIKRIHHHLIKAIQEGCISQDRLDASVERILTLKIPLDRRYSRLV